MDNVTIERPWRSPKHDCVCLRAFETGSAARADIGRWIDVHNTERPHSALGGPIEAHQGPGLKAARSTGKPDSAANPSGNRGLPQFAYDDAGDIYRCPAEEELTYRYTTEEDGLHLRRDRTNACRDCPLKYRCTTGKERRITRWEHEHLVEEMQRRIGGGGGWMRLRRATVEHPFGTIKA